MNSEYITGIETFSDRTDLGTLVPFLKELKRQHKGKYAEVTADAGYESLENYLYLEKNGQMSFIKPSNYEARKTKRFKEQVGRIENMTYDEQWDAFICAYGKTLSLRRETTELVQGRPVTTSWYRCEDCTNCPHRVCLLSGKGSCEAEGSRAEEDFLGNAGGVSGEHYNRAWYFPADVPFYPGRGGVWTAQKRLWFSPFSDQRENQYPD